MIEVKIKLSPGATLPTRSYNTDSGYDLFASSDPIGGFGSTGK